MICTFEPLTTALETEYTIPFTLTTKALDGAVIAESVSL